MKTLNLMRHAEADRQQHGVEDRERILGPRGRLDAPRMGSRLAEVLSPMSVHCSPALRARQTLAGLCTGWPQLAAHPHQVVEALYTFELGDLLHWLQQQPGTRDHLFLLGHNPGLTDLVNHLAPADRLPSLPTAGFIQLALAIPYWEALAPACGEVRLRLFPEPR